MRAVVLSVILYIGTVSALQSWDLSGPDQLRNKFIQLEIDLWNRLNEDSFKTKEQRPEVLLITYYQNFHDLIEKEFPNDITYGLKTIESMWVWARMYAELRGIYTLYETFKRFEALQTVPGKSPSPPKDWEEMSETILSYSKNIPELLGNINELIIKERLYADVAKEIEGDMICESQQSSQQILMNLYNAIAITELKGYSMIQFSYMLLKLYGRGNFTKEANLMRTRFEERTQQSIKAVQKAMQQSSRDLWRCDPKKYIKDETFLEITELLQGYLQNEVDLNSDGTCRETCSEYTYTKSHGCYDNLWCRKQRRCEGKVINCRFYDSDMKVCPGNPQHNRRYEYIEYENGKILGRKQGCSRGTSSVDSWWRWLFWHCSYCMCLCDDPGPNSDRYISLKPAFSNVRDNRVVTGLRFKKSNRIIHLQIQEGKLMPRGTIDPNTVQWVPITEFKITDRGIYNKQDYHMLSWESRAVDLDDLESDERHIVTGVRFKLIGSHLNFEIYMSPFNFTTGKLEEAEKASFWKSNINTDLSRNPRKELKLNTPDVPTRSPSPSIPDSKSNMYLQFINSDYDRDAAQTTVPFIDAQSVESLVPVPLAGAGIYHKGRDRFGGFLAPKIITYDYSKHLSAQFPDEAYQAKSKTYYDVVDIVPVN